MDGDKKSVLFDRPLHERNQDKRLIIILERASLETVKVSLEHAILILSLSSALTVCDTY